MSNINASNFPSTLSTVLCKFMPPSIAICIARKLTGDMGAVWQLCCVVLFLPCRHILMSCQWPQTRVVRVSRRHFGNRVLSVRRLSSQRVV